MTVQEIARLIEQWAPPAIAWERDNVGLQAGDPAARVRGILVALDPLPAIVEEAKARGANLVVTHHPLLFREVRSVTPGTHVGRTLRALLRHDIALYVAHTNLDFTRGGTSFALAQTLGLREPRFLEQIPRSNRKIVTFVPSADATRVAAAMADAGGGWIGRYSNCSFRAEGVGSFRGEEGTSPLIGKAGRLEEAPEVRLEMVAPSWAVPAVVAAMRRTHPYEEMAYDVYPLETPAEGAGYGVIGETPVPLPLDEFVDHVKKRLRAQGVRWSGRPRKTVRTVAVCGGSGGELIERAGEGGADAFVTADLKYHPFREATDEMALIDAGHYETERPVVDAIVGHLRTEFQRLGTRIAVRAASRMSNPVRVT